MQEKALVLGGGGVAGIAWMTGLALGLQDGGVELALADTIFGTSAGSTVAVHLAGNTSLAELFRRQVDPDLQVPELKPVFDYRALARHSLPVLLNFRDPASRIRAIGKLARSARTIEPAKRLAIIDERLPEKNWPRKKLIIVTISANTGDVLQISKDSGIGLREAVAASCAVPLAWPPVEIHGELYMDGGFRTYDNADLAVGFGKVLIVSPLGTTRKSSRRALGSAIQRLRSAGAEVRTIAPDNAARKAMGRDPLAPESRQPSAQAGRAQGRHEAQLLRSFWP